VAVRRAAPAMKAVAIERPGRSTLVVYVFGRYVRIAHWIRNGLLLWLIGSGIYIGNPFLTRTAMGETATTFILAQVRGWHVIAGWVLLAFTLARIYQFLFVTPSGKLGLGAELRMAPILFDLKAWRDQLAFYLLLRRDHPHITYSNYGPLQYLIYTVLYATLLVISVTGIILASPYLSSGLAAFGASLMRPIEVAMGGLANVRAVHRFTMWWFVVFTLIHIYMAVWNSLRTGNMLIEGIVSGFKAEDISVERAVAEQTGQTAAAAPSESPDAPPTEDERETPEGPLPGDLGPKGPAT
jgi:Ni/Fe-hydrogenase 1 B-type cytochrome subunit